jgi:hypothetical protein
VVLLNVGNDFCASLPLFVTLMLHTIVRHLSNALDVSLGRRHGADSPPANRTNARPGSADAHVQVQAWKEAWVAGAQARWSGAPFVKNPHQPRSSAAAAWGAGWRWAEQQPDRRRPEVVRFAHPYRRSTDTPSRVIRSARAGAVGLSVLTLAGWLWQIRRNRNSTRRP